MNGLTPNMGYDKVLPALAKVKSELGAVTKKANNPFFKSKYADLNTYLDEVEPLLESNGLLLLQPVLSYSDHNFVTSRIYHVESGQYVESSMRLVGDTDMQKAGSGITYARRYTLGALLSMKSEDDDGNTAVGKTVSKPGPKPAAKVTAATTPTVTASVLTPKATETTPEPAKPVGRPSFRKPAATPTPAATPAVETPQDDL